MSNTKLIKKLRNFLRTATPSGFADGLMFGKYQDLLEDLMEGNNHESAVLTHFLNR